MLITRLVEGLLGIGFAVGVTMALGGYTPAYPPSSGALLLLVAGLVLAKGTKGLARLAGPAFVRLAGVTLTLVALLLVWGAVNGAKYDSAYMRSALEGIDRSETAAHDSTGRFFTDPHLARDVFWDMLRIRSAGTPVITLTADGFTAVIVSNASGERCAIFEGSTGAEPAATPGTTECWSPTTSATLWKGCALALAALATAVILARRPANTAAPSPV